MAADEKWRHSDPVQEEEEEEALSLCDLPVNLINEEQQSSKEEAKATGKNEDEFDFVPWGGRFSIGSKMCAADDLFFQGQILPGRFSVGSETSVNMFSRHNSLNQGRRISRSESTGHVSLGWSTSFSSRSSSSRSPRSSSSTSSSVTASAKIPKPRTPNQFLTLQSPKLQIRTSSASLGRNPASNRTRKSSVWDMLKRGLVRTPAFELQDLKVRNSVSRNSSSSSSSSVSNSTIQNFGHMSNNDGGKNAEKQTKQSKQRALLGGCSCSVSAVKPVTLNTLNTKSSGSTVDDVNNDKSGRESTEEKMKEAKIKKKMEEKHRGKKAMSRHRTFEWIKQL